MSQLRNPTRHAGTLVLLVLLALALAAGGGLAGCARGTTSSASGVRAVPPSPLASSPASPSPAPSGPCASRDPAATTLTITVPDNGAIFCVPAGTRVEVLLQGTAQQRWSAVGAPGGVLLPAASGKGALMVGETGGFFAAARAGTADVVSYLAPCTETDPQATACDAAHRFHATVIVR